MPEITKKMAFASPEWVDYAIALVEELVAKNAKEGDSFSMSELFTDAPKGMSGPDSTTAGWHFRIKDKTVTAGHGKLADADWAIEADYEKTVPSARFVHTPEMLEKSRQKPSVIKSRATGKEVTVPPYVSELHNKLAVVTK